MSWKILIYQSRMKMTSTKHRSTPGARILCGVSGERKSSDNQEILIPRFWRTLKDGYPCQASIIFDDLWKHLISEAQKETKCKLIFSLITLHLIRVLQPTSTWNFIIRSKDCVSVSSPRYAILTSGIFPVQV